MIPLGQEERDRLEWALKVNSIGISELKDYEREAMELALEGEEELARKVFLEGRARDPEVGGDAPQ